MARFQTLRLFAITAIAVLIGGCSLLVDFDRSLLVDAGVDAGPDANVSTGQDAGADGN
jgi:hypothetical protein